jgi:hypothetical protein
MAKQQTFADKAKKRTQATGVNVKFVKAIKTEKGTYKFQEKFVKMDDINQVTNLKLKPPKAAFFIFANYQGYFLQT